MPDQPRCNHCLSIIASHFRASTSSRSLARVIRLRLSDRGRQLAVDPRVFAVLIAGPAVSYKCPLSREPLAANRASARGTLSNYLRKPSLCRVIYVALLRRPDARAL